MSGKSAWKTVSVQDCGCLNQQRHPFSTHPLKRGEVPLAARVKPCAEHEILPKSADDFVGGSENYFDEFVDGRGF